MSNIVPSIEEIYNHYHRETMFAMKGFYPKSIKNFEKCINETNIELLKKFQNFLIRNGTIINWKIYIESLAKYYKRRFDLKILGSLSSTKIYKQYVEFLNVPENLSEIEIKDRIKNSLFFISNYLKENQITFDEYFNLDSLSIPTYIKHLNSGTVSKLFYACFDFNKRIKMFFNTPDDIFYEFFYMSKNAYNNSIENERKQILKFSSIKTIIQKFEKKFGK